MRRQLPAARAASRKGERMRNANRIDRERWKSQNRGVGAAGAGAARFGDVRAKKGFGPNKASGHKGGISRQGSKR